MNADLDMLLLDYASGAMPEGPALAVAAKLAIDPAARADMRLLEATGGALFADADAEPVSESLLAATLGRLDHDAGRPVLSEPAPDEETRRLLPPPLWRYAPRGLEGLRWQQWGKNVREAVLPLADRRYRATLLQVRGGHGVLRHTHEGTELTVVLAGSFHDETGRYGPGAMQICDDTVRHRPVADRGEDCLCLGVVSAPLHFTGLIGRFINPRMKF
ncbi:ChrR family anti-sigma-E factor [Emcibacter sp. SYSU 3D8]|uniref:ChrR family anti-sigma-E factor n=1 Tax=Emcibacter sp. SYSU 3D8 TaxID=3133969 RepID=UPI0031FEF1E4